MRPLLYILFSIFIIACNQDTRKDKFNDSAAPESFHLSYISRILHDCNCYYGGPKNPWDCCTDDVDLIKDFSIDTLKILLENHRYADSIITDKDIYDLLSQTIFPDTTKSVPDSDATLLQQETFTHLGHLNFNNFILYESAYIDKNDVLFLLSQLTCESYFWGDKKIKNVKCISTKDLKDIFFVPENTPKGDSMRSVLKNCKNKFKQKYGRDSWVRYSKPIFNKSKTFAIIEYSTSVGGDLLFFKKINNVWKLTIKRETYIV